MNDGPVRLADLAPAGRRIVLALLEAERANHKVDAIVSASAAGDAMGGPGDRGSTPAPGPPRHRRRAA
jgi:hypothetical protein